MKSIPQVAADFDMIADALAHATPRRRLSPAERALLKHVPGSAARAIDVGCGDGVITRALAKHGLEVLGVDVSPRMIDLARRRTASSLKIEYRRLDIMNDESPSGGFDVVVSVAMVHHLPLGVVVPRLVSLVGPGGVLLIQDVVSRQGLSQIPINAAAWLARRWRWLDPTARMSSSVAAAYQAHGADEHYLDARRVRDAYRALVPAARVYHHLEWRYSVVWRCPARPG